jgi:hypothetical protein
MKRRREFISQTRFVRFATFPSPWGRRTRMTIVGLYAVRLSSRTTWRPAKALVRREPLEGATEPASTPHDLATLVPVRSESVCGWRRRYAAP